MLRLIQQRTDMFKHTQACPSQLIWGIYYRTCLIMRLGINPKMPDKSLIAQTKISRRSKHFRSWIYLGQSGYLMIFAVKRRTCLLLSNHKNNQSSNLTIKNHYLDTGYSFWDRLHNFLHKFIWIVFSVHKLNKLGKFW